MSRSGDATGMRNRISVLYYENLTPQTKILCCVAVLMPLFSIYESYGLTWLGLLVAIALTAVEARRGDFLPNRNRRLACVFGAFLLWGAITVFWSVDPGRSLDRLPALAALLVGVSALIGAAYRASPDERRALALALAFGFVLALPFLVFERLFGAPLMTAFGHDTKSAGISLFAPFNHGLTILAVLLWPTVLGLVGAGWRRSGWLLGGAVIICIWFFQGTSMSVSVGIGIVAFLLVLFRQRQVLVALRIAATLWVVVSPFAMYGVLAPLDLEAMVNRVQISELHRLHIWKFASGKVIDRPITGCGLDAARSVPGASDKVILKTEPIVRTGDKIPLHTHNVPLQLWLELGVVGAGLAAAIVWLAFSVPLTLTNRLSSALVAGELVTGFGILNLSYGAWQAWWQGGFALAALLTLILLGRDGSGYGQQPRRGCQKQHPASAGF